MWIGRRGGQISGGAGSNEEVRPFYCILCQKKYLCSEFAFLHWGDEGGGGGGDGSDGGDDEGGDSDLVNCASSFVASPHTPRSVLLCL